MFSAPRNAPPRDGGDAHAAATAPMSPSRKVLIGLALVLGIYAFGLLRYARASAAATTAFKFAPFWLKTPRTAPHVDR